MGIEDKLTAAGFERQDETIWRAELPWFYVQIEVQPTQYAVSLGHVDTQEVLGNSLHPCEFDLNTYELPQADYDHPATFPLKELDTALQYAKKTREILREKGTLITSIFRDALIYARRESPEIPTSEVDDAVIKLVAMVLTIMTTPDYVTPEMVLELGEKD